MVRVKKVKGNLTKAFSHIHMTGLRGHEAALGMWFEGIKDRVVFKRFLRESDKTGTGLDMFEKTTKEHDIARAEEIQKEFDMHTIDGSDHAYKLHFSNYLVLRRCVTRIKLSKIAADTHGNKELRAALHSFSKNIGKFLQNQQKVINSIGGVLEGHINIAAVGVGKSQNRILNYFTGRKAIKKEFKTAKSIEKEVKKLSLELNHGAVPKKHIEHLNKDLLEEVDGIIKFMKLINTHWIAMCKHIVLDKELLKRALMGHELPGAFVEDENKLLEGIAALIHKQLHSIHIIHNQVDSERKKVFSKVD